jgi:hypothetical protein
MLVEDFTEKEVSDAVCIFFFSILRESIWCYLVHRSIRAPCLMVSIMNLIKPVGILERTSIKSRCHLVPNGLTLASNTFLLCFRVWNVCCVHMLECLVWNYLKSDFVLLGQDNQRTEMLADLSVVIVTLQSLLEVHVSTRRLLLVNWEFFMDKEANCLTSWIDCCLSQGRRLVLLGSCEYISTLFQCTNLRNSFVAR